MPEMSENKKPSRRPLDLAAVLTCVVLCFIWGLQQVAIKAAGPDISPMLQVSLRSGAAAVLLLIFSKLVMRERWSVRMTWRDGCLLALGFAGEFFFVAEGLRFTSAAHMSVLLYTAPLFAAVGLAVKLPEERLSLVQWTGVAVAFLGIATAFLLPAILSDAPAGGSLWWLGDILGLLSGVSWGLTIIVMRVTTVNEAAPTQMLFWQLAGAFVTLLPCAFLMGETAFVPTLIGVSSLAFQIFIVSFASYLVWCRLIKVYLAARLGILVFMTPMFGVILSVLLLGESVGWPFIIGSLMVLLGIIAVQNPHFFRRS